MLFLVALIVLVLYQLRRDIRIVDRLEPVDALHSPLKRVGIVFVLLLVAPFLFVRISGLGESVPLDKPTEWAICIFISFLISERTLSGVSGLSTRSIRLAVVMVRNVFSCCAGVISRVAAIRFRISLRNISS